MAATKGAILSLLQDAVKEWDTPQVRQDLDEVGLALQNRRERLSVAEFEVRGEVGIPAAGRKCRPGPSGVTDISQPTPASGETRVRASRWPGATAW